MNLTNVTEDDTLIINDTEYPVDDVSVEDIGITEIIVIATHNDGGKRLIETTTSNSDAKIVDVDNETYWTGPVSDITVKDDPQHD